MARSPYETIKQRIVLLDFQPGSPLSMTALAKELGTSVTPIREALIRLEADGLVHRVPNSTPRVSDVLLHDLKDVLEARLLIIEQIARLAAQRVQPDEIEAMRRILEHMRETQDRRELIRLDSEFHAMVNQATKNHTLGQVADLLRNHVMRLWYYIRNEHTYWEGLIAEREHLIQALEAGDVELMTRILKSHVTSFVEEVRASTWG